MSFNLREKCHDSRKRDFFYGAKINKEIKNVYLGLCFLEPGESNRKAGPVKGHEELLYLTNRQIQIESKNEQITLNEGEVYFISDSLKIKLNNLSDERAYFVIAGGHTKFHEH